MKYLRFYFLVGVCFEFNLNCFSQGSKVMTFTVNDYSFPMIYVQGGTFVMGATPEQREDALSDEYPPHHVELNDYWIGQYEVTQGLWEAVMGNNPSMSEHSDEVPIEGISWEDCWTFIDKLNDLLQDELGDKHFALPTEAQWEYAARGGNRSKGYKYAGGDYIDRVAWYTYNANSSPHPVGQKMANELGLYDMSGNIDEWCFDIHGYYSCSRNIQKNPRGASRGEGRVIRGGSCISTDYGCRVSSRYGADVKGLYAHQGLRLVLVSNKWQYYKHKK